ncbi:MAG: RHS repeat-associated core domain-containing protein [Chloroflexi bacterium]|nr:RHS repeat-associated core domain-containing protein [Chloroflexota bacterium]
MESVSAPTNGVPRLRLDFGYDWQGRRAAKTVLTNWNGSVYLTTNLTRFLYDGWQLLAELDATNRVLRSYAWGLDLSGGLGGAGGIGGLVALRDYATPATSHVPCYDGNGNVVALVNAGDQTLSARYEYGPFGEPLRATGPMARLNPFRWSTKFCDNETDLVYYGYRYYSPSLGRWLSRDPIEEEGGVNLYGFVCNGTLNLYDSDGRFLGSLMLSVLRGAAISGVLNGVVATVNKLGFKNGTWRDVLRSTAQGMVIGGLTGGTGAMLKAAAQSLLATGYGGALGPMAGAFLGGVNAGIGYVAGQQLFGERSLRDQLRSPEGLVGFSISVAVGAFLSGVGAAAEESRAEGTALDVSLEIAGSIGGAAAMTVYDALESTFNMIRQYRDKLDP